MPFRWTRSSGIWTRALIETHQTRKRKQEPEVDPPCSKEDEEEKTGKIGKQTRTLSVRIVAMEESEAGGNESAEEGPKWRGTE